MQELVAGNQALQWSQENLQEFDKTLLLCYGTQDRDTAFLVTLSNNMKVI